MDIRNSCARGWIREVDPNGVEARSLAGRYRGEYGVPSQQADLGLRLLAIESTLRNGYPRRKPRGTVIAQDAEAAKARVVSKLVDRLKEELETKGDSARLSRTR